MKGVVKFFGIFAFVSAMSFAQDATPSKFALVIGNANYSTLSRLSNPVNDANDVTIALEYLGFTVEKILNSDLEHMEDAVTRLKDKLKDSEDAYGFFFYAGHGVQSGGENFLIPVNDFIPSESYLRNRALSVQVVLDDLNEAGNNLNVVVLDACRDNPFGWSRGGNRGLAFITRQPADSIIVYATSAGQTANDGDGRNGLFTSQLLPNLITPGLDVTEIFKRTGADVSKASSNRQIPAIYSQFFKTAYLGIQPDDEKFLTDSQRPIIFRDQNNPLFTDSSRLWTVGAAMGTSFNAPWFIGTVQGTIAPWRKSFFELGIDTGWGSGERNVKHISLYPFTHCSFFLPFTKGGGWHIGAGMGYMYTDYTFPVEGHISDGFITADLATGIIFKNGITVSYAIRTNFVDAISNKIAVGYSYRFIQKGN